MMATKAMVSSPDEFLREMDRIAQEEHCSRSKLVPEALRLYIGLRGGQGPQRVHFFVRGALRVQDRRSQAPRGPGQDSTADSRLVPIAEIQERDFGLAAGTLTRDEAEAYRHSAEITAWLLELERQILSSIAELHETWRMERKPALTPSATTAGRSGCRGTTIGRRGRISRLQVHGSRNVFWKILS